MRISKKKIYNGQLAPQWYGEAYYDIMKDYFVFYPLGIHLIVRLGAWIVRCWYKYVKFGAPEYIRLRDLKAGK